MRVLCCNPPGGAFYHITEAWGDVFRYCGHKFKKWDGKQDTWDKFKPDLYIGCSGHKQPIPRNRKCKVCIHVNPYSSKPLRKINGVDINEPIQNIKWTINQKPDFVFGYGLQEQEKYWELYEKTHNIPWYGIPTAGNLLHYYPNKSKEYSGDIGYIGGRWDYKANVIDKYLVPVLKKYRKNLQLFGWGGWEKVGLRYNKLSGQNIGEIRTDVDRLIFSSCKICPAISEPHTIEYNIDWPERIFKTTLCGSLTVSNHIKNFDKYMDSKIFPTAQNPNQFMHIINYYIENDPQREELAKKQRKYVLENHTYFERVSTFLRACGRNDYDLTKYKNKFLESIGE